MGNWQLEVARMAMYLAFPVGLFYWFNLPGNSDKYCQMFPERLGNDNEQLREEFNKIIDDFNSGKLPRKLGLQKNENTSVK